VPSEEIEKFRIIESRKNYEDADQWLRNFKEATWDECRTLLTFYCPPGEEMLRMLSMFREWEKEGKQPHQVQETPSGNLEDDLRVALAQFRGSLDYLSLVGSTIRPGGYTQSLSWGILSRDYFLAPFNEKGASGGFLTITGRPRMGKSGIACLYGEMWIDEYPGSEVLTNVPLQRNTDHVRPVTDILGLLNGIADALNAKRRWQWQYDEPSLSGWMKSDALTGRAKNLERFARIIPKLGGSFIYIEQREEGVPTTIQDFSQSHIYCTNPGAIFADLPGKRGPIIHVPKPRRIAYRTGEAGYFSVPADFAWDELFRTLRFDPFTNTIEAADEITQGTRIQRFLSRTEEAKPKQDRPNVTCRFCGESWMPRSDEPPERCPRCRKVDPLGIRQAETPPEAPEPEPRLVEPPTL
jgi:hypothetical protein